MAYRRGIRLYSVWAWLAGCAVLHFHPAAAQDIATQHWAGETGVASYYGPSHQGKRTAAGGRFDQRALTAAHPWLPFGTKVRVTVAGTHRSVVVVVNDRLPSHRRVIDLSVAAAKVLGILRQGVAQVSLSPV